MSKHWSERLADLSVEQLQDLIAELGEIAILTRQLNAKLLMRQIEGMDLKSAYLLVAAENPWETGAAGAAGNSTSFVETLSTLFARNRLTDVQLLNLLQLCGERNRSTFQRAVSRYMGDPAYVAQVANAQEVLDHVMKQQGDTDEPNGKKAAADAEACSDEFDDAEREAARRWLRENWGIEDEADWEMLLDALQCTRRADPVGFNKPGLRARNAFVAKALRLRDEARAVNWTPSALVEWRQVAPKIGTAACNPNGIFTRPDGQQVYGNGDPVMRDKNGQPRRRVSTIFGVDMPEGSAPTEDEIRQRVKTAYGKKAARM